MEREGIETALAGLQPALESDGFMLQLAPEQEPGTATILLEASPDACMDCLVPDETLISIVEAAIADEGVEVDRVVLVKKGFDEPTNGQQPTHHT